MRKLGIIISIFFILIFVASCGLSLSEEDIINDKIDKYTQTVSGITDTSEKVSFDFTKEDYENPTVQNAISQDIVQFVSSGDVHKAVVICQSIYDETSKEYEFVIDAYKKGLSEIDSLDMLWNMMQDGYQVYIEMGFKAIENSIKENGSKTPTLKSNGYYQGRETEYSHNVVGLSNSPLYDSLYIRYFGDYKIVYKSGVKLNSYYEETSYGEYEVYYKDSYIGDDTKLINFDAIETGNYLILYEDNLVHHLIKLFYNK